MVVLDGPVTLAPERSYVQRIDALKRANEVRYYRAQLKRDMKTGDRRLPEVLESGDPLLASMKVYDVLLAVPSLGRQKIRYALERAHVSPSKTIGGMTDRQRRDLLLRLSAWPMVRASLVGPAPKGASVRAAGTMES